MKKKRTAGLLIAAAALAFALCGCGGNAIPKMTDAEYEQVVTYSAGLLTKYAKGSSDRLTYVDLAEEAVVQPAAEGGTEQARAEQSTDRPQETAPQTAAAVDPETPASDVETAAPDVEEETESSLSSDDGTAGPEAAEEVPAEEAREEKEEADAARQAVDMPRTGDESEEAPEFSAAAADAMLRAATGGLSVSYEGYSVKSAYPGAEAQGAVIAGSGKKLLVLDFSVRNRTEREISVSMPKTGFRSRLIINGADEGFCLTTMIENDLGSYIGTIPAGESRDMVLVKELPEGTAKSVDTLSLFVQTKDGSGTISLE